MLRACVTHLKGKWGNHLLSIEFSYNNSYHSNICFAPFETLYVRRCRSPIRWLEVGESSLFGSEIIFEALEKVRMMRDRLKKAYTQKKSYADNI